METYQKFNFRLPSELLMRAQAESKKLNLSVSAYIRYLLSNEFNKIDDAK